MSLFKFNVYRSSEELTPPQLRGNIMLAWLRVILRPLHRLSKLFTEDFILGSDYDDYDNSKTYVLEDRIIWVDGSVYEIKVNTAIGIPPTGGADSDGTWLKILDSHIGTDERLTYNNQIIVFENALNRRWKNYAPSDLIYIENHSPWSGAVYAFTIHVPITLYTSLGVDTASRENSIRQFVDQYNYPAYEYLVTTF